MLYMVVERFKPGAVDEIYCRAQVSGRMLPEGLEYIDSWVDLDFNTCYQLMRTENEELFQKWISHWQDLVYFDIIPVRASAEAFQVISPRLNTP